MMTNTKVSTSNSIFFMLKAICTAAESASQEVYEKYAENY